jgi:hypothetical protein
MIREYLSPAQVDEDKYVYDVYYTEGTEDNTADFDDFMLDNLGNERHSHPILHVRYLPRYFNVIDSSVAAAV